MLKVLMSGLLAMLPAAAAYADASTAENCLEDAIRSGDKATLDACFEKKRVAREARQAGFWAEYAKEKEKEKDFRAIECAGTKVENVETEPDMAAALQDEKTALLQLARYCGNGRQATHSGGRAALVAARSLGFDKFSGSLYCDDPTKHERYFRFTAEKDGKPTSFLVNLLRTGDAGALEYSVASYSEESLQGPLARKQVCDLFVGPEGPRTGAMAQLAPEWRQTNSVAAGGGPDRGVAAQAKTKALTLEQKLARCSEEAKNSRQRSRCQSSVRSAEACKGKKNCKTAGIGGR